MRASQKRAVLAAATLAILVSIKPPAEAVTFSTDTLPDGTKYVLVSGAFEPSDDFAAFPALVSRYRPDFIAFNSPGGTTIRALAFGRLIRLLNLNTLQTRPYQCDSACAFAFVGGVNRFATAGSIGVHRQSLRKDADRNPNLESEVLQHLTGELLSYLREMGISSELLEIALKTDSDDMRHLTRREMLRLGVITRTDYSPPLAKRPTPPLHTPPPAQPQTVPSPKTGNNAHECDRLAANPNDKRKLSTVDGIDYNSLLLHRKDAATACEQALKDFPNELRFKYQFARAIELDDPKRAARIYSQLITAGYLVAYDNLGWMYNTGRVRGHKDRAAALKLFLEGAKRGDPDCMHSLGVFFWEEDSRQALSWFKRAEANGHKDAANSIQRLQEHVQKDPSVFPLFR